MAVVINAFKAALAKDRPQIGLWQALVSPIAAEICATAGYDWLLFDGEHAPNDLASLSDQLRAVAPHPAQAVGRPPASEAWMIKQYLDIGFQTLLVPMVDTGEQAQALVRAARYPPAGVRGVGNAISRAGRWNRFADYLSWADDQICLLAQIETVTALKNLEDIASVEGVDGLFVGPADLSASMGFLGERGHPTVVAAVDDAIARIVGAGKAAGVLVGDVASARKYIDLGCRFVAVGSDISMFAKAVGDMARCFNAAAPNSSTGY